MSNKNILFIVEGENDESDFISRLFKVCYKNQTYQFYKYKTNIHVLADKLNKEFPDFDEHEDLDIKLILRSIYGDKDGVLSREYTDIYMIFDFEPQHSNPHFEMIKRMLAYFNESYDMGKLFINYPMMQSYKHLSKLPDEQFIHRCVSHDEILHYKDKVDKESDYKHLSAYDYFTIYSIAVHHLKKANYILNDKYSIPDKNDYMNWDAVEIYEKQLSSFIEDDSVSVLNTSIFVLPDYNITKFFKQISDGKDKFML